MTHHIHDSIDEVQAALTTFKTTAPPDGVGRIYVSPTSRSIEVSWVRPDETYAWHHPDEESKAKAERDARDSALHFLAVWTSRLKLLSDPDHKVLKTFGDYSVSVEIRTADGWTFTAKATADMVCEIRPVLDDDGEPVMEEVEDYETTTTTVMKLVPRTTKECPRSFLADFADEAG